MKNKVILSTYKIILIGSAKFPVLQKINERIFNEGNYKLLLDNTHHHTYVHFLNYNYKNIKVILKSDDNQLYNPVETLNYINIDGIKIVPLKVFKSIKVIKKIKENFITNNYTPNNCTFKIIYNLILLIFIYYLIFYKN